MYENGAKVVCNAAAANQGGNFAMIMMLAAVGYVVADVAADGLTVQYARSEPVAHRGCVTRHDASVATQGDVSSFTLVFTGTPRPRRTSLARWGRSRATCSWGSA